MKLFVPRESHPGETRVAVTPEVAAKLIGKGHEVAIQPGAGTRAGFPDAEYEAVGARLSDAPAGAALLVCVRRPALAMLQALPEGAAVLGLLEPADLDLAPYRKRGLHVLAMERVPRSSRAQSMDTLSSQSNLAGYRAVLEAAHLYGRVFPMMMTAAGTAAPAKVFVMGAGVAGLQAIATAKRLGAVVSATDVRPAAKEQVASLSAKFIAVEDDEFKAAETAGGYAKQMSDAYQRKQAELVAAHIAKQDIVITTALIPGRKAPILVTEAMVASMKPGSVIVDMAAANGGNCPLSRPDEVVRKRGVAVFGPLNLPARLAQDASKLYARNIAAFLPLVTAEGEEAALDLETEDEIVRAMLMKADAPAEGGA